MGWRTTRRLLQNQIWDSRACARALRGVLTVMQDEKEPRTRSKSTTAKHSSH